MGILYEMKRFSTIFRIFRIDRKWKLSSDHALSSLASCQVLLNTEVCNKGISSSVTERGPIKNVCILLKITVKCWWAHQAPLYHVLWLPSTKERKEKFSLWLSAASLIRMEEWRYESALEASDREWVVSFIPSLFATRAGAPSTQCICCWANLRADMWFVQKWKISQPHQESAISWSCAPQPC
jgi:hypothetical protein